MLESGDTSWGFGCERLGDATIARISGWGGETEFDLPSDPEERHLAVTDAICGLVIAARRGPCVVLGIEEVRAMPDLLPDEASLLATI